MKTNPGIIVNLGLAAMERQPLLDPRTTTIQPRCVQRGDGYTLAAWGAPMERMVTRKPLDNPTQYKKPTDIDSSTFESALVDDELLGSLSEDALAEAARLHAESAGLWGQNLLQLNRALLYATCARRGVCIDPLRDQPSGVPIGSEGIGH